MFCKNLKENSIKHTLDLLHHFHHCAGLKLNKHKTEAFQLGVVSNNTDSKYGLKWGSKKVKVTGVTVGKKYEDAYNSFNRRESCKG